jgi:hypothetical protein
MPAVDLANEIMEVRLGLIVAEGGDVELPNDWPDKAIGTSGSADELAAMPDPVYNQGQLPAAFVRNRAYVHLARRRFPFNAPYNLWSDEAATYLRALGVPRHELCRIFAPDARPPDELSAVHTETMLRLGLSRGAFDIIRGADDDKPHELWGFKTSSSYVTALANVRTFLQSAGLTYDELRELMATSWAESEGVDLEGNSCKLDELSISGLTDTKLQYLHRLLRLRERTQLTLTEIDRARASLIGTLNASALTKFALALDLHQRLAVSWSTALVWWGDIDTRSSWSPSTFHKLFLDKSARNPNDEDIAVLVSTPAGEGLSLQDVIPGLVLGTRLTEQGLRFLLPVDAGGAVAVTTIGALALPAVLDSRQTLTLSNLSRILRHASFARALRLPLPELLVLKALSGSAPLAGDPGHDGPPDTAAFVELVERVRSGPFSVAEIDYILRDRPYPGLRPDTSPWVTAIGAGIGRLHADAEALDDPSGERTKSLLEELFGTEGTAVGEILDAIAQPIANPEDEDAPGWRASIERLEPYVEDLADALLQLLGSPRLPHNERFNYVARRLQRYVASRAFVRTWAAQAFSIPVNVAEFLLETRLVWVREAPSASVPAMRALLPGSNVKAIDPQADPALPAALVLEAEAPKIDAILRRLHKAALLARKLNLDLARVEFLFRSDELGTLPLLDLNALRTSEATADDPMPTAEFRALLRIIDLAALGRRFPSGAAVLHDLLRVFTVGTRPAGVAFPFPLWGQPQPSPKQPPDLTKALRDLADAAGWLDEDVILLAERFGYVSRTRLCDVDALVRLDAAMRALTTLGARASAAVQWVTFPSSNDVNLEVPRGAPSEEKTARDVVRHLRGRYEDDDAWSAVAKPLRDGIRERQRQALAQALLQHLSFETPSELSEHLLIDVETSAAPMTSRIVQASAAVQTFVQRVLLTLEPNCSMDDETLEIWKWMKSYRVWEANRKVFLFPENYLVPELRDDKSPLFRELETFLLQGPLTSERAEQAVLRYLGGLEEVAHLTPLAFCAGEEPAGMDTIHQVAASADPRRYYYRVRQDGRYQPWQPVDLDIEGEHLAIIEAERHVYLFWLQVEDLASPYQSPGDDGPEMRQCRLTLNYSELRGGTWSPKTTIRPVETGVHFFRRHLRLGLLALGGGQLYVEVNAVRQTHRDHYRRISGWRIDPLRRNATHAYYWGSFPDNDSVADVSDDDAVVTVNDAADSNHWLDYDFISEPNPFTNTYRPGLLADGQRDGAPSFAFEILEGAATYSYEVPTTLSLMLNHQWYDDPDVEYWNPKNYVVFHSLPDGGGASVLPPVRLLSDYDDLQWLNVFTDRFRSFLLEARPRPARGEVEAGDLQFRVNQSLRCSLLVHPRASAFRSVAATQGVDAFYASSTLQYEEFPLAGWYSPDNSLFAPWHPFPSDKVDFALHSAYGAYNWEVFFHIPMLLATRFARAGRHEDAQRWFRYIFDPTRNQGAAPSRYWRPKPFYEMKDLDDIAAELEALAEGELATGSGARGVQQATWGGASSDGSAELRDQIAEWSRDPFDPFAIARLRNLAFMKWVFQAYVQNLLDWGDKLFSQDTLETVNEAAQLYAHALDLLGPRPVFIEPPGGHATMTYADLEDNLDEFGNAIVGAENLMPGPVREQDMTSSQMQNELLLSSGAASWEPSAYVARRTGEGRTRGTTLRGAARSELQAREAGTPFQEAGRQDRPGAATTATGRAASELQYHDHQPNQGLTMVASTFRGLYFCVPPNEQLLGLWDLVDDRLFKIRHGLNIEGIARTLPLFAPPIDPALLVAATAAGLDLSEVVADLNSAAPHYRFSAIIAKANEYVNAVLSLGAALLSAMEKRDAEELAILRQSHEIAVHQATIAVRKQQVKEAHAAIAALEQSKAPVQVRYEFYANAREIYDDEDAALDVGAKGQDKLSTAGTISLSAKSTCAMPDFVVGSAGMGAANWTQIGGSLGAKAIEAVATMNELQGSRLVAQSGSLATRAGYRRRHEDSKREAAALAQELAGIDKQLVAARLRLAIAEHEQAVVEKQIAQSREVNDVLKNKFTSRQLYEWMVGETSAVYFQAYQLGYDMARKAERAFQIERGDDSQRYINFGNWDGVHQGLLAGERLALDLRRLDAAYIAQNRREYELSKNVSLAEHDPIQLLWLRETGVASFTVTEEDYDRDHATHYLRRLKAVAVSIPCVTGPVQGVAGRLTLFKGETRAKATATELKSSVGVLQSIVTSSGQNDAGLFEVNLKDERLLPFEGVGAHATASTVQPQWKFELAAGADFDRSSIDDLVLHLRYTAREGYSGGKPYQAVRWRMIRLRTEFAEAWNAYQEGDADAISFSVERHHLPIPPAPQGGAAPSWKLAQVRVVTVNPGGAVGVTLDAPAALGLALGAPTPVGTLRQFADDTVETDRIDAFGAWSLGFDGLPSDDRALMTDAWVLLGYNAPAPGP